jgi:hypothetical protein
MYIPKGFIFCLNCVSVYLVFILVTILFLNEASFLYLTVSQIMPAGLLAVFDNM